MDGNRRIGILEGRHVASAYERTGARVVIVIHIIIIVVVFFILIMLILASLVHWPPPPHTLHCSQSAVYMPSQEGWGENTCKSFFNRSGYFKGLWVEIGVFGMQGDGRKACCARAGSFVVVFVVFVVVVIIIIAIQP